jgi:hypothetical protein
MALGLGGLTGKKIKILINNHEAELLITSGMENVSVDDAIAVAREI